MTESEEKKDRSEDGKARESTDRSSISRREFLTSAGAAGVAYVAGNLLGPSVGAAHGKNAAPALGAPGGGSFLLPMNVDTYRNFETFLRAIEDSKVRQGLGRHGNELPRGVKDLVLMIDDPEFLNLGTIAVNTYNDMLAGAATEEQVRIVGQKLRNYLSITYPDGFDLLQTYASKVGAARPAGFAVNLETAANAVAVVNALVWANAAVATMAVAVLAVFVAT